MVLKCDGGVSTTNYDADLVGIKNSPRHSMDTPESAQGTAIKPAMLAKHCRIEDFFYRILRSKNAQIDNFHFFDMRKAGYERVLFLTETDK